MPIAEQHVTPPGWRLRADFQPGLLAYALGHLGERERETALLRRAQRGHPEDFWINNDLARSSMGAGQPDEAARFYSAAVAIRPRSHLAHSGLRAERRAAGGPE